MLRISKLADYAILVMVEMAVLRHGHAARRRWPNGLAWNCPPSVRC